MRYRFAVLDGPRAAARHASRRADAAPAVRHEVRGALSPVAADSGSVSRTITPTAADYPIPPSGHMVGIYARTDIERGVHKAPANEVVRGITGLQRILNKEQHDILNPYPGQHQRDPRLPHQQPRHPRVRRARHHQRFRLEVRQRAPAADLHRGVDRPRPAVGGVRAQRGAAVGARAPVDHATS